jgi:hypothetical protein
MEATPLKMRTIMESEIKVIKNNPTPDNPKNFGLIRHHVEVQKVSIFELQILW